MSKLIGAVSELNKFLRTILVCVVVGGASYCGGWLYNNLYPQAALKHKDERIQEISDTLQATQQELAQSNEKVLTLTQSLAAAHEQVERLDASIRLLKVDSRVAEITVLKQVANPQSGRAMTEFSFQEVDQDGSALDAPRRFVIDGEVVYVDYWVVKFRDQHVEEGTEGLSTSICLFRRIFGEHQEICVRLVAEAVLASGQTQGD